LPRTFDYRFDPAALDPLGGSATATLTVQEVEDAGLKEILQTPGARFAPWSVLAGLLVAGRAHAPFVFDEPLGRTRETRRALSDLFARCVARAWLERHLGLAAFCHVDAATPWIRRNAPGDLPDWLAVDLATGRLAIAEAKGCRAKAGVDAALARAWDQAQRIDVMAGGGLAAVDRIAVAMHWGVRGRSATTRLVVRAAAGADSADDPVAARAGLVRAHFANLLVGLGFPRLAAALRAISAAPPERLPQRLRAAHDLLAAARSTFVEGLPTAHLVGRLLTRSGPTPALHVTDDERRALGRLRLHPQFVGIERSALAAAIDGAAIAGAGEPVAPSHFVGRRDRGGLWIVPLGSRLALGAPEQ
jgi:hypothetical protein